MSTTNQPAQRYDQYSAANGSQVFVWGGPLDYVFPNGPTAYFADGAMFDVTDETWSPLPTQNAPIARNGDFNVAVWNGDTFLIWGGLDAASATQLQTGAIYDHNARTWTEMSVDNAPDSANLPGSDRRYVTFSHEMLIIDRKGQGAAFDAVANAWHLLATTGPPPADSSA